MTHPMIHLNGTSARSLAEEYSKCGNALDAAIQSLRDCWPNGRDYYPISPNAINDATKEHEARLQKVRAVFEEIRELYEHCAEYVK